MPILPTESINTNAPNLGQGPSIARAGLVGQAIAGAGQQVQNFGAELAAKRKQAEIRSYVSSNRSEFERYKADKLVELESKYTGDPTGLAAEMNEALNDFGIQSLERAPNDDAKALWEEDFASLSSNTGTYAFNLENEKRGKYQVGLIDENIYKDQQHLSQNPDPTRAVDFLNNNLEAVNSGIGLWFDETSAKEKNRKTGESITTSLMEGFETKKQYQAAMNILDNKNPNSKIILSNMSGEDIAKYKDRFTRLAKAENEFNKTLYKKEIGDVSAALQSGEKVDPSVLSGAIYKMQQLPPEERVYMADDLDHDLKYNEMLQQVKTLDINDAQAMSLTVIPRKQGDVFNAQSRDAKASAYRSKAKEIIEQRLTSAPTFWAQADQQIGNLEMMAKDTTNPEALKKWSDVIVSKQANDKSGDVQILSKDMSKVYADQIKSPNKDFAEMAYMSLKQGTQGQVNHFGNAITDMVKNKDLTEKQALILMMDDDKSRQELLAASKNEAAINIGYKNYLAVNEDAKYLEKELRSAPEVQDIFKSIGVADPSGERVWLSNAVYSSLELAYRDGIVNGQMEPEKAKERALNIIKSNFSVASAGRSSVIVTGNFKNKISDIEGYLDSSLDINHLKSMDIQVPNSYMGNDVEFDPKERYLEDLSKKGQWISNENQNGAILVKRDGKDLAAVRTSKGGRVEVFFDQMYSGLPVTSKAKNAQAKANILQNRKF